eukprot:TRINITY_DN5527_c0_g2_i1.p1 TRINITY_DN5527_c0_g2~~TRINITY_DN5527_c0_g2_i1.p1  ORF type:complete len:340 (-),score=88.26 TRINITY_DN5527_c0_g2_i1:140-1159(-)
MGNICFSVDLPASNRNSAGSEYSEHKNNWDDRIDDQAIPDLRVDLERGSVVPVRESTPPPNDGEDNEGADEGDEEGDEEGDDEGYLSPKPHDLQVASFPCIDDDHLASTGTLEAVQTERVAGLASEASPQKPALRIEVPSSFSREPESEPEGSLKLNDKKRRSKNRLQRKQSSFAASDATEPTAPAAPPAAEGRATSKPEAVAERPERRKATFDKEKEQATERRGSDGNFSSEAMSPPIDSARRGSDPDFMDPADDDQLDDGPKSTMAPKMVWKERSEAEIEAARKARRAFQTAADGERKRKTMINARRQSIRVDGTRKQDKNQKADNKFEPVVMRHGR